LEEKDERYSGAMMESARCFIRYDEFEDTEKKIFLCITFQDLGKCVDDLLSSIVDNEVKKPQFNIGFIPENDTDVQYITSMKVREVCSALESELELAKITVEQEAEFQNLVKKLRKTVKDHRDGKTPLSEPKIYDYILGTLKHMAGPLSDRIENCFLEYQPVMGEWLKKSRIEELVNYRNTITHGNYMQLNSDLAETTYILMKLVYCCVLKRIGMEKDKIKNLMDRRVVS
jgi:hypothetical protein